MDMSSGRTAQRRTVASYDTYTGAQEAIDRLSDEGFPVQHTSIVAEGLRFEERVTGRLNYGRAALRGAGFGVLPGAIVGFGLGVLSLVDSLVSALVLLVVGAAFGAAIGAVTGLVTHASSGGRRDFSAVGGLKADRYQVTADEEVAGLAESLLSGHRAGDAAGGIGDEST